jgi:hypothetical protein
MEQKDLEAEAVFLHTAITPRIQKALLITGEGVTGRGAGVVRRCYKT